MLFAPKVATKSFWNISRKLRWSPCSAQVTITYNEPGKLDYSYLYNYQQFDSLGTSFQQKWGQEIYEIYHSNIYLLKPKLYLIVNYKKISSYPSPENNYNVNREFSVWVALKLFSVLEMRCLNYSWREIILLKIVIWCQL